jgi:hypothetical protein
VRRPAAWTVLAVLIIASLAVPGSASQIVEIRLRGHYFSAPATVVVNIAIEPGVDNYRLVIEADSPKFFRSSKIELTGVDERRIHTIQFKNLPEGAYLLRAEVQSRTAVLGQASQELTVMGGGL